jgi:hypothetical protein
MKYYESSKLAKIAHKMIYSGKKTLEAKGAKIKFLLLESKKSNCLGKCIKASALIHYLTGYDFIVYIWDTFWKDATKKQRQALLLHELLHIKKGVDRNEKVKWTLKKHDLEEFSAVVKKYGLWLEEHRSFARSLSGKTEKKKSKSGKLRDI